MERSVFHVRKKDLVQIMIGKERGKTGKILRVVNKTGRVVIEKLNIIKRHTRPTGKKPGGIIEMEAPISAYNVLLFCSKCGKGVRTKGRLLENGKKIRCCAKCDTALDK